jgi:hypothetical protein
MKQTKPKYFNNIKDNSSPKIKNEQKITQTHKKYVNGLKEWLQNVQNAVNVVVMKDNKILNKIYLNNF